MKVFIFTILLLAFSIVNYAQDYCFSIIDSATNKPIPYCNIQLQNQGFVSNHLGQFCISDKPLLIDTIFISNISYYTTILLIDSDSNDSLIYLVPKTYGIREIDINWSNYKFWWRGNQLVRPDQYKTLWHSCQTGLYITAPKNKECIIETVSVLIKDKQKERLPIRLHVYDVDSLGNIGIELLPENVYMTLDKGELGYVKFDVLIYQIKVPKSGVFVSVELLSNKKAVLSKSNIQTDKYIVSNKIAFTKARYRHRKLLKVSSWKPGSFYIESYPFTNIPGYVGELPVLKVKLRGWK